MNKPAQTNEHGFTLIELLLVTVIIGILLAVIVPRAWRANVDAKYGLVRQAATELVAFATQWAGEQIEAQTLDSLSTTNNYFQTLCGGTTAGTAHYTGEDNSNWNKRGTLASVPGRNNSNAAPETSVEGIMPPERIPRNPFNGLEYFLAGNAPTGTYNFIPGALACSWQPDSGFHYFALVFQGTDNTPTNLGFHAGMATNTINGLRNGVFMARLSQ